MSEEEAHKFAVLILDEMTSYIVSHPEIFKTKREKGKKGEMNK